MNKNIFIVLFVVSAVLNIYFFVRKNENKGETVQALESYSEESLAVAGEREVLLDSIRKLAIERSELKYFNLQDNSFAQNYFKKMGINSPTELITSAILKTNTDKGTHSLVRFESENSSFQINKVKILNHKWIICDFSDGENWGELLLRYHINDDKSIKFVVIDDLMYP